jgi:hypothetical protein
VGNDLLQRVAREPLVHFLVLGVVIFGFVELRPRQGPPEGTETIVVSEGKIDQMIEIWTRTRMRPPTVPELRGLIDAHVQEEVLYREALALGLDRDDTIVRRRLAQKLDFVAEGLAGVPEPTDEDLQALLNAEPQRFRTGGSTSFRQVFINVEERRESAYGDAVALLARLRADDPEPAESLSLGDPILLEHEYRDLPVDQLERQFGAAFAEAFESLDPGTWSGPVESAYGLHLVRVMDLEPPRVPALEEIRDAVREEWLAQRRRDAQDAFHQALRDKYEVVIEMPSVAGAAASNDEGQAP